MEACPKISVVVPIYKVEEYLDDCVKSILSQDFQDIEVLLVDDGSPDNCPAMCDGYAKADGRVKVLHKANGGLSDARNAGIKAAVGQYIIFIDSDDFWLDSHFLSKLIERTKEYPDADLIFFGRTTFYGEHTFANNHIESDNVNGKPLYDGLKYLLQSNDFLTSACMKLVRTSVLKDNEIYFAKGRLSEDLDWSLTLYQHIGAIAAIDDNPYGYRKRPGSITTTLSPKHVDDLIGFFDRWTSESVGNKFRDLNLSYLAYTYSGLLATLNKLPEESRPQIKNRLKRYSYLLDNKLNPKVRKVSMAYRLLGYNLTCVLLKIYYKNRRR